MWLTATAIRKLNNLLEILALGPDESGQLHDRQGQDKTFTVKGVSFVWDGKNWVMQQPNRA